MRDAGGIRTHEAGRHLLATEAGLTTSLRRHASRGVRYLLSFGTPRPAGIQHLNDASPPGRHALAGLALSTPIISDRASMSSRKLLLSIGLGINTQFNCLSILHDLISSNQLANACPQHVFWIPGRAVYHRREFADSRRAITASACLEVR